MNTRNKTYMAVVWPVAGAVSLLVLWWLVIVVFDVEEYIAPTPLGVLKAIQADFSLLMWNLLPTMTEAISGFLLGNGFAILVAIAFVHSMTLERMYFPIAVLFNTIPIIALAPILIHVLGLGMAPKIAIATIICFFPTLVNMIRGFRACSTNELELMHVLSASRREIFFKLRLPRSLPFLFASLKITSTTAVIGAIVGEWIGSSQGIGALIIQATFNYRIGLLYAAIVVSSLFSLLLFALVVQAEKYFLKWN